MLSKEAITDYQRIFQIEFGKKLSEQEAEEQAIKLLRLFNLIYKPIPKEWLKKKKPKRLSNGFM